MTLKEYAKQINALVKEGHGAKVVYYAVDEEGNGFKPVVYAPTAMADPDSNEPDLKVVCIN
jgi:hypothetical protein